MLKLSKSDIRHGYNGIKRLAQKAAQKGDYEKAWGYIRHCVTLAQQFNWIYADFELEDVLKTIGERTIPEVTSDYVPDDNRVVLYDDFHTTVILAAQYVEALVKAGKDVLYVNFMLPYDYARQNEMVDFIKRRYPTVKILTVPVLSKVEFIKYLYKTILDFRPSQLILHIYAYSGIVPLLYRLPKQIDKYIINLADQTFWLGASAVDYVLEFRQFGVSVSQQRRGIKPEQQLLVPFYPIVDENPFQGFPKGCSDPDKVLVFSGSDIYKVLDERRMFWHLVKRVLDTFPQVVFLFATKGDNIGMDFLHKFITENHYEGRFFYTKFRPDINEVLAHTDIYMGTCPASGSLMSQLAARNATPILQYYYPGTPDDETEQAICYNEDFRISFQDENDFMKEADRLVNDVFYRRAQGERLQKAMISIDQFNDLVKNTLESNKTIVALKPYSVDYKMLDDRWFELEKMGYLSTMPYIYGLLGKKYCLRYAPVLFLKKQLNRLL